MITKYTRGMVYWAKIPRYDENPNIQSGIRPVIIVSNDIGNFFSNNVTIVPCTTNIDDKENQPTHAITSLNTKDKTVVLCEDIITVHKSLLQTFMGILDEQTMNKIDKCIMASLGLSDIPNPINNKPIKTDNIEIKEEIKEIKETKEEKLERIKKVNRGRKVLGKIEMKKFIHFAETHTREETAAEYGLPNIIAVSTRLRYYKKKLG